jgi:serine protease Do
VRGPHWFPAPRRTLRASLPLAIVALLWPLATRLAAQESFSNVAASVNSRMVKLFGAGGFQGLASYGSGFLVSADGYILTTASHVLLTDSLRVHLADGRRLDGHVAVMEPDLDAALVKIDKVENLPYFDIAATSKVPPARPGDWILAFSNEFQVATGDEPVSVQKGVIAAYAKLRGRRGVFQVSYAGDVYLIDAVTNNIGSSGGMVTTRDGRPLGMIGKELRNSLTNTWINYAVPIQALVTFVDKGKRGEYRPTVRSVPTEGEIGYHGLTLVPNVLERTPPFVESVAPGSPAARAGLKSDDLIISIDGQQVPSIKAVEAVLARARPGSSVKIEARRSDKQAAGGERLITAEIVLVNRPPQQELPK